MNENLSEIWKKSIKIIDKKLINMGKKCVQIERKSKKKLMLKIEKITTNYWKLGKTWQKRVKTDLKYEKKPWKSKNL